MDKKEQRQAHSPQSLSSAAKRLLLQPRVETELAERCAASEMTKHYALTLNKLEFQQWMAQAQRKPEQFPFALRAQRLVGDVAEDGFAVALRWAASQANVPVADGKDVGYQLADHSLKLLLDIEVPTAKTIESQNTNQQ